MPTEFPPDDATVVAAASISSMTDKEEPQPTTQKTQNDTQIKQSEPSVPPVLSTTPNSSSASNAHSTKDKITPKHNPETNRSKGEKEVINKVKLSGAANRTFAGASDAPVSRKPTLSATDSKPTHPSGSMPLTAQDDNTPPSNTLSSSIPSTTSKSAVLPSAPVVIASSLKLSDKPKPTSTIPMANGSQQEVDEAESIGDVSSSSSSSSSASSFRYESSTGGSSDSESSYDGEKQPTRSRKGKAALNNRSTVHSSNSTSTTRRSRRQLDPSSRLPDSDVANGDMSGNAEQLSSSRRSEKSDAHPKRTSSQRSETLTDEDTSYKRKRMSPVDSSIFPNASAAATADLMEFDPDSEVFRVPIDCGIARIAGVKRSRNHTYTQISPAAGRESTHPSNAAASTIDAGKSDNHADGVQPSTLIFQCYSPYFGNEVETFRASGDPYHNRVLFRAAMLARKAHCSLNRVAMYLARQRGCATGVFQAATFSDKPKGCQGLKAGGYFVSVHACEMYEQRSIEIRNRNMVAAPREEIKPTHNGNNYHIHPKFAHTPTTVDNIHVPNSALLSTSTSSTNPSVIPSSTLSSALNSASLLLSRAAAVVSQARASFNSTETTTLSAADGTSTTPTALQDSTTKGPFASLGESSAPATTSSQIPSDKLPASPVLKREESPAPVTSRSDSSTNLPDSVVKQELSNPRDVLITIAAPYKWSSAPAHLLSRYHLYTDGLPNVYPAEDFPSHLYSDPPSKPGSTLTMLELDERLSAYLSERFCLAKWQARKRMRLDRSDRPFEKDGAMTPSSGSESDNGDIDISRRKLGVDGADSGDATGALMADIKASAKRKRSRSHKYVLKMDDIPAAVQKAYPHLAAANAALAATASHSAAPLPHQFAFHTPPPFPMQVPPYAPYAMNSYPAPYGANPMYGAPMYPAGYGAMPPPPIPYAMPQSLDMPGLPPHSLSTMVSSAASTYAPLSHLSIDHTNSNQYLNSAANAQAPNGKTQGENGTLAFHPYAPWPSTDPNHNQSNNYQTALNPLVHPNPIHRAPLTVGSDTPPTYPADYLSSFAMVPQHPTVGKSFEPLHRPQVPMNFAPQSGMPLMNNNYPGPTVPYRGMPMYQPPPSPGSFPYAATSDGKLNEMQLKPIADGQQLPSTVPPQYPYYHMPLPALPPNVQSMSR